MNILHVYYEPAYSGITRHVGLIVEPLRKEEKHYRFFVLCSTSDERIPAYFQSLDLPVSQTRGAKYFSLSGMFKLIYFIRKWKIDIVHIHNLQSVFWANLPKIFYPRVKFIFTPQVIDFDNKTIEKYFYMIWKYFSLLSTKIVALSSEQKQILVQSHIKKKEDIEVIPNSVTFPEVVEDYQPDRNELHKPYILSIVRLVSQKRPEMLIEIAEKVAQRHPRAFFYIAGEGPLRDDLYALIKEKKLGDKVVLLGFRTDIVDLIIHSEIILSTASREGMPYTLLESMALGKPAVASNIIGHISLIENGKNGYLCKDIPEYVNRIDELLADDEKREKMEINARRLYREHFSYPKFLQRMRNLYDGVTSG